MFVAGLEDTIEVRLELVAHHMNLYSRESFTEFSWEFILDKVLMLLVDPRWVPDMDPKPLPHCILTDFLTVLSNTTAT